MSDSELVTWLRAQLDDDEVSARFAIQAGGLGRWRELSSGVLDIGAPGLDGLVPIGDMRISRHAVRFDPARVLADVAAKRAILDLAESAALRRDADVTGDPVARLEKALAKVTAPELDRVVRLLAQPYADQSGYREEWRPE
jgi:hypothetical protein